MDTITSPQTVAYESNPFKLVRPSWESFKRCWKPLVLLWLMALGVGVFAAILIIGFLIVGAVLLRNAGVIGSLLLLLVALVGLATLVVASGVSQWVTVKLVLGAVKGKSLTLGEAFPTQAGQPLRLIWSEFVAGLAILAGLICLVVPGLIMMVWFMYVPNVVVDEGLSGWAAAQRSRELVKGHFWEALAASCMAYVGYALNYIPFIGWLFYLALSIVVMAVPFLRYSQLKVLNRDPKAKPAFHWLNLLVVLFALCAIGYDGANQYQDAQKNVQLEKSTQ